MLPVGLPLDAPSSKLSPVKQVCSGIAVHRFGLFKPGDARRPAPPHTQRSKLKMLLPTIPFRGAHRLRRRSEHLKRKKSGEERQVIVAHLRCLVADTKNDGCGNKLANACRCL